MCGESYVYLDPNDYSKPVLKEDDMSDDDDEIEKYEEVEDCCHTCLYKFPNAVNVARERDRESP